MAKSLIIIVIIIILKKLIIIIVIVPVSFGICIVQRQRGGTHVNIQVRRKPSTTT
jgi:hypothetical protein